MNHRQDTAAHKATHPWITSHPSPGAVAPPTTPLGPRDPDRIGPWQILGIVGRGGMGVVYLGQRDTRRGIQRAAVKVILEEHLQHPESAGRFRREIAALYALHDPGVARVVASDLDDDPAWYATEHVVAATLHDHVAGHGPLDSGLWRDLAVGLLRTLAAVHDHGITHRDIKPGNILLGPTGPVLVDFGIATLAAGTRLTLTGYQSPGTPGWNAPEQITGGHPTGPATDVFAAGLVLAWAATGRHPHDVSGAATWRELERSIVHQPPHLGALAPQFRGLVGAMLAKDPRHRPAAAEALQGLDPGDPTDLVPGPAPRADDVRPGRAVSAIGQPASSAAGDTSHGRAVQHPAGDPHTDAHEARPHNVGRQSSAAAASGSRRAAAALIGTGVDLDRRGRAKKALTVFQQVIDCHSDDTAPVVRDLVSVALAYKCSELAQLRRTEEALAVYRQVTHRRTDEADRAIREHISTALLNTGTALDRIGHTEEALAVYRHIAYRYSDDPGPAVRSTVDQALVNSGAVLARLGRPEEAVAAYGRASSWPRPRKGSRWSRRRG